MISNVWGKVSDGRDLSTETTASNLRMMDEDGHKSLLFVALRACDLPSIRNILQVNRHLVNSKMYGYEGTDVFDVIKSKNKRCYSYTGVEKDGFFYPLHVSAESGHKNLTILLVKAGADQNLTDYRGCTAEDKCNGNSVHAFLELRGFRFESVERYQGKTDRNGARHGQGVLFFKPEGYQLEEKQLYRGTFKNNLYHGHGTLYWPGTDNAAYVGRFKGGMKHGRGIEFDKNGIKVYQGTFRDDKREGKGEEFAESVRVYRGEFSDNTRHGFGVAFPGDNARYFGRYENNAMSGVGIYCHPNGDRVEGMFYNDKLDGPTTFYERDTNTGQMHASHFMWQGGKKGKEINSAFVPTAADLPDYSNQNVFAEIMNRNSGGDEEAETAAAKEKNEPQYVARMYRTFAYYDVHEHVESVPKSDVWKVQLGKYLKLPLKEAKYLGLEVPENHLALGRVNSLGLDDEEVKEAGVVGVDDEDDPDEEMDEITGYHFVDCTTLFVSYVYVNSAAKVFEDRLVNRGMMTEFPDFETVYHLVIDAVDSYNDQWETLYKQQQQLIIAQQIEDAKPQPYRKSSPAPGEVRSSSPLPLHQPKVEATRMVFMSEKEKKEELILRQRAELAIKKGTAELDPTFEKQIAADVLGALESELSKLLVEELEQQNASGGGAASSAKNSNSGGNVGHGKGGAGGGGAHGKSGTKSNSNSPHGSKTIASRRLAASHHHLDHKKDAKEGGLGGSLARNTSVITTTTEQIDLDDLFDVNYDEHHPTTLTGGSVGSAAVDVHPEDEVTTPATNEFAAELLYIMKTSRSLC